MSSSKLVNKGEQDFTLLENLAGEIDEIPEDSIISKTIADNEQFKAVLFGFSPGQGLSEHRVPQNAVLHFLEGEAQVTLGNEQRQAWPGAWVHMPPDLPHSIRARSAVKMLLLMLKR